MSLPESLEHVRKYLGMHLVVRDVWSVTALLTGYDLATDGAFLRGFREWLIVRRNGGNNLAWMYLVLELTFPRIGDPLEFFDDPEKHRIAIESVFDLLSEFLAARSSTNGLRAIYVSYENWLRRQRWYGPDHPAWLALERRPSRPR